MIAAGECTGQVRQPATGVRRCGLQRLHGFIEGSLPGVQAVRSEDQNGERGDVHDCVLGQPEVPLHEGQEGSGRPVDAALQRYAIPPLQAVLLLRLARQLLPFDAEGLAQPFAAAWSDAGDLLATLPAADLGLADLAVGSELFLRLAPLFTEELQGLGVQGVGH